MGFAVELAELNVRHKTGGPFGAAVFEMDTGVLVAPGVNTVIASRCSHAHAEMAAIAIAQQTLGTHDLRERDLPAYELVTSCEPCAMCLGAVVWSGLRGLVCGAREEDARAIGFDEGPRTTNWTRELEARGIVVTRDVNRDQARSVLVRYVLEGGRIYSPEKPSEVKQRLGLA
jgi:tRNA(Arg) A34 adenosine deaminase TadA